MKKSMVGVIGGLLGVVIGAMAVGKVTSKTIDNKQEKINKFNSYYNMLNRWLALKQNGKSLVKYFNEYNYKKIAIYGMGEIGNRLYDELKNTDLEVVFALDKNAESRYAQLDVKELDDELPEVDVIVVTATFAFDEIVESVREKITCPIISLEDVVYEI